MTLQFGEPDVSFVVVDNNTASEKMLRLVLDIAKLAHDFDYYRKIFLVVPPLLHAELSRRALMPSLTSPFARNNKLPALLRENQYKGLLLVSDVLPSGAPGGLPDGDKSADELFLHKIRRVLKKHWVALEREGVVGEVTELLHRVQTEGTVEFQYAGAFPDLFRPLADQLSDYVVAAFYTHSRVHQLASKELGSLFKFDKADHSIRDLGRFCSAVAAEHPEVKFNYIVTTHDAGARADIEQGVTPHPNFDANVHDSMTQAEWLERILGSVSTHIEHEGLLDTPAEDRIVALQTQIGELRESLRAQSRRGRPHKPDAPDPVVRR